MSTAQPKEVAFGLQKMNKETLSAALALKVKINEALGTLAEARSLLSSHVKECDEAIVTEINKAIDEINEAIYGLNVAVFGHTSFFDKASQLFEQERRLKIKKRLMRKKR